MNNITAIEMLAVVKSVDIGGITLTDDGRKIARIILAKRTAWTSAHKAMLERIDNGETMLPHSLRKLVSHTRLADILELARKIARPHIRNQKAKARRKAAKARRAAA